MLLKLRFEDDFFFCYNWKKSVGDGGWRRWFLLLFDSWYVWCKLSLLEGLKVMVLFVVERVERVEKY